MSGFIATEVAFRLFVGEKDIKVLHAAELRPLAAASSRVFLKEAIMASE